MAMFSSDQAKTSAVKSAIQSSQSIQSVTPTSICLDARRARLGAELHGHGVQGVEGAEEHQLGVGGDVGPAELKVERKMLLSLQVLKGKKMR